MAEIGLDTLQPAKGATKTRKRVGRGPASGSGKTAGRGTKGQKSRAGSKKVRAGFEGGQMPIYMRIGKLRGSTHKMSMPMGPFRTRTQPVNLSRLDVFEDGQPITPRLLLDKGIVRHLRHPVKILGEGEVTKKFIVAGCQLSSSARAKIEEAGGTVEFITRIDARFGGESDGGAESPGRTETRSAAESKSAGNSKSAGEPKSEEKSTSADESKSGGGESQNGGDDQTPDEPVGPDA